jgi:intracellular sulfur oxidation DsrE/DsrF family protein
MLKMLDARLIAAAVALALSISAQAAPSDAPGFWQTPAIEGYGRIHNLPEAAYQPKPGHIYKVVFSVTSGAKQPDQINAALDRVARTVNLYAAAGVPLKDLKFVAVVSGAATPLVLDDAHYREAFGVPNPNLPEIAALRKAGVDVAVCGQAVAEHGYSYGSIDNSVTLSLAALTTITTLEQQGYSLLPL